MRAHGLAVLLLLAQSPALCDETNLSEIQIEQKPREITSAYGQLFTLQGGVFSPDSVQLDNGTYHFDYGSPTSILAELGWAPKLFESTGAFYLEENLAFSIFRGGTSPACDLPQLAGSNYSLYVIAFDNRLMYSATWVPWKIVIPFVDIGYMYTIFYQPGGTGFESAQGGVGNAVGALGLRIWLNKQESLAGSVPFFATVKLNRIFSRDVDMNLGSTTILGGLSIGL